MVGCSSHLRRLGGLLTIFTSTSETLWCILRITTFLRADYVLVFCLRALQTLCNYTMCTYMCKYIVGGWGGCPHFGMLGGLTVFTSPSLWCILSHSFEEAHLPLQCALHLNLRRALCCQVNILQTLKLMLRHSCIKWEILALSAT